jgi:hypothetical protein
MACEKSSGRAVGAVAVSVLLVAIGCLGQESSQKPPEERVLNHSCTVDAAATVGTFLLQLGEDRKNFDDAGWGVQAGGGFEVARSSEPYHGNSWYATANFMYQKFKVNGKALGMASAENNPQLQNVTSAHGGFPAVTIDPTFRHFFSRTWGFYAGGGFGWLGRDISFNGANIKMSTLLFPNNATLQRLSSNSGVLDIGGGVNISPRKLGGFMVFAEARAYHGLAINSGDTLLPISVGVRW